MSPAVRIALFGFADFEREHIEAGLRPVGAHSPVYLLVDTLAACSLAVVNADHEASVAEIMRHGRMGSSVMLGTTVRPGAAVQLPRPLSLVTLLQALHRLARATPAMSAAVRRVHDDLARFVARPAAPPPPGFAPVVPGRAASRPATPAPKRTVLDQVLVVDEDSTVLRFMTTQLQRLGFEVHLTRSGAEAIERVTRHHFEFVFLATGMEGADGFHLCRTLKRSAYPHRRAPPVVVLLLAEAAAVNTLRAEQAGADACLVKPVRTEQLLGLVGARVARQPVEAQTTHAGSSAWL